MDSLTPDQDPYSKENFLDPAWEDQQKKTFTAWCNSHLRKVNSQITDILEDFKDGLKLMELLEVISNEQLSKPERGKMRFHKISNINKALDFISNKGVRLISVGAEEICDGNCKMTLGMIWTIILRFAIQNITVDEMTAKEGLLLWCQRKTVNYKNVNVQNFHISFKDGLAFCALLHKHRPDLLDFHSLSKDNPMENLNLAFQIAADHLDIPRMLDPEDIVNNAKPDDLSIMAYVSSYYHAFSGAQKTETATHRISKFLIYHMQNHQLVEEYEKISIELLSWIMKKLEYLGSRPDEVTLQIAHTRLEEFRHYRRVEKPPKFEDKARLEATFSTLQTRLRLRGKSAYAPTQDRTVTQINKNWKELELVEKQFEEWLLAEINRYETMEHLAKQFYLKCTTFDSWSTNNLHLLSNEMSADTGLSELRANLKKLEAFECELNAQQARVDSINRIANELDRLSYYDMGKVTERTDHVQDNWKQINEISSSKKRSFTEALTLQKKVDQLYLQYAKAAGNLNLWLEQSIEDMQDVIVVNNVKEIEALISQHQVFQKSVPKLELQLEEIRGFVKEIESISPEQGFCNTYSLVLFKDLCERYDLLMTLLPVYHENLQSELIKQQTNEKLCILFGNDANTLSEWIEGKISEVRALLSNSLELSLEVQRDSLLQMESTVLEAEERVNNLEILNQKLQESLILDNPHTTSSMEMIRIGWEQLVTAIRRSINELDNQILTRDSKGISEEQMEEFRKSFIHFDKNKTGMLEPNEFKSCLVSLGYNVHNSYNNNNSLKRRPSVQIDDSSFTKILHQVDPSDTGHVKFDAFLDFMTQETVDTDSSSQIIESFKIISGDKEYIDEESLRRDLPPDQVNFLLKQIPRFPGSDNRYDYRNFVEILYNEQNN